MKVKKSMIAGALAVAAFAATLVVGFAPAASACATAHIRTGLGGPGQTVASTCGDLSLIGADDTSGANFDGYAGFLYNSSTGGWQICSSGYYLTADFTASSSSQWVILCTGVLHGTKEGVGSLFDAPDWVWIAY